MIADIAPAPAPVTGCAHSLDALRYDGIWQMGGTMMASVSCCACGTSRTIPVRPDVADAAALLRRMTGALEAAQLLFAAIAQANDLTGDMRRSVRIRMALDALLLDDVGGARGIVTPFSEREHSLRVLP